MSAIYGVYLVYHPTSGKHLLQFGELQYEVTTNQPMSDVPQATNLVILYDNLHAKNGPLPPPYNPFKPEFTIVIFIHYKPGIAVAILDL